MQFFKKSWHSKPLPLFRDCSVFSNERVIGILTNKQVGRAQQTEFDVGTSEARLPIDEPTLLVACRTALSQSFAVPTAEIRAFPDFLGTERRFKLWTDMLSKLDDRKSIYKVWQNMELVTIINDATGYTVAPQQKVRFQSFTSVLGPNGNPISPRFSQLEDAVIELRRWLVRP